MKDLTKSGDLRVREAKKKDFARILEISKTSFAREFEVFGFSKETIKRQVRLYRLIQLVQRLIRKAFFKLYVGEVGGEAVGTTSLNKQGETWYIGMVMVAPEHRRRGYGRELVSKACSAAKSFGVERGVLHVREDNLPAKGLYQSLGFSVFERVIHLHRDACKLDDEKAQSAPEYELLKLSPFDREALRVADACREEASARIYGRSHLPPFYVRLLSTILRPELKERYAILKGTRWIGIYTFSFTSKEEASHASVRLYEENRGKGIEEALLTQASNRAFKLGAPRLAISLNEQNVELKEACKALGFSSSFVMEGMFKEL